MSLQDTFYILGIITMSLSLIILIVLAAAVLVIRNKIIHIQRAIEDKLSFANAAADVAKRVIKKK
jgi:hypothetical protein